MLINRIVICVFCVAIFSCKQKSRWEIPYKEQNPEITFNYLYKDFFNEAKSLNQIKETYPIFFPEPTQSNELTSVDSLTIKLRKDSINIAAFKEVEKLFPNQESVEEKLVPVFQRLNYYYPKLNKFQIYFSVGMFDEFTQPILFDPFSGNIFVALDLFLGSDFPAYDVIKAPENIPEYYQKQYLHPEFLAPAMANEIAEQIVAFNPNQVKFLDQMIYYGKQMIVLDALLPNISDEQKIGFSTDQMNWCKENESNIWTYFVEHNLLFQADESMNVRFFQPSPYSKFGTETEQNSPGKTGVWTGWQICKKYLNQNPEIDLVEFCKDLDYQKIYKESGYKP